MNQQVEGRNHNRYSSESTVRFGFRSCSYPLHHGEGEAEHIAESGLINLKDVTILGEIPEEESPEPDKVEVVVKIQVQTGIAA